MTSPRQQFLANHNLRDQWGAIAHQAWFKDVIVAAWAEFSTRSPGKEASEGVKAFVEVLETLADEEPDPPSVQTPCMDRRVADPVKVKQDSRKKN